MQLLRMEKIILLNIFIYIAVLLLSLLIIINSKKGYLNLRLKNYCNTNSIGEFIILLFIISGMIMVILYLFISIFSVFQIELVNKNSGFVFMVNDTNNQDPVRWWPSGTPQSWGILGTALGVYRLVPGSSRVKAIAALGSLGITVPSTVFFHAVENPNGFNRLMYSWMKYKQTGDWPSNIPNTVQDNEINEIIPSVLLEAQGKYDLVKNSSSSSTFLPNEFNNFLDIFTLDNLHLFILEIFRPVSVVGYLDDLIGQQLFILLLLFIIVLSLIVLLTIYFFIQIMVNNKEFLLNKFKNKFILFFIKYQLILAKISSFVLPLLIMFGLIQLIIGLYFLLTHPIPYDKLGIDLHTFIK